MKKKFALSILIGAFFLWLAFRNVSLKEVATQISTVHIKYVVLAFLVGILSHVFRAQRWGVILKGIKKISFYELFTINMVGFFFIHVFPFRIGEFTKPYLLKKKHGVKMSTGFGTVAIERVFDGLTLILFLIGSLFFANFKTEKLPYVGIDIDYLIAMGGGIFGFAFLFLILLVYKKPLALKILWKATFFLSHKKRERLQQIMETFVHGLSSLPSLKDTFWTAFHSLTIWLCAVLIMYLSFKAFDMVLPWEASFVTLGIVSLGIMLPAPPGFVGNFQLFCQGALGLYGVSAAAGLSYSIVVHAINIAGVFLLGLIFLPENMKYVSFKTVADADKDGGMNEALDETTEH